MLKVATTETWFFLEEIVKSESFENPVNYLLNSSD